MNTFVQIAAKLFIEHLIIDPYLTKYQHNKGNRMEINNLLARKNLRDYLLYHENDIANDINDFADLRLVFIEILNRKPYKDT